MKKIFFCITLCSLYFFSIGQKGIELGGLVQPQIYSQLYDNAPAERALKVPYSFCIGANVGYNFTPQFGLRTGFLYSPQGERYADTSTDPETAYNLNLEYLQVPLYLKLNARTDNTVSFLMFLGPHFSFLNNATLGVNENDPISVLGDHKRFLLGASFAFGIQFNIDDDSNLNIVWRTSGSLDTVQEEGSFSSYNIVTGLQLAYHYFLKY